MIENFEVGLKPSKESKIKLFQLYRELFFLAHFFYENCIEAIALKGPLLSKRLFNDVTTRQCGDLDLVVDKEEVFVVSRMLESLGYNRIDSLHKLKGNKKDYLTYYRHISLYNPDKEILLEVHWQPLGWRWNKSFHYQTIESELPAIKILNKDSEFVYLCLHAFDHSWSQLKWLWDIYTLMKKQSYEHLFQLKKWEPFYNEVRDTMFLAQYYFGNDDVRPRTISEKQAVKISRFYQKHMGINVSELNYMDRLVLSLQRNFMEYKCSGVMGVYKELWFAFFGAQFYKINTKSKLLKHMLAPFYYIFQLRKG